MRPKHCYFFKAPQIILVAVRVKNYCYKLWTPLGMPSAQHTAWHIVGDQQCLLNKKWCHPGFYQVQGSLMNHWGPYFRSYLSNMFKSMSIISWASTMCPSTELGTFSEWSLLFSIKHYMVGATNFSVYTFLKVMLREARSLTRTQLINSRTRIFIQAHLLQIPLSSLLGMFLKMLNMKYRYCFLYFANFYALSFIDGKWYCFSNCGGYAKFPI